MAALMMAAPFALLSYAFAAQTAGSAKQRVGKLAVPPQTDIQPFEHAKVSLIEAVAEVQKQVGGEPFEARFELWRGQPSYVVRTYHDAGVSQERVNADTSDAMEQPSAMTQEQLSPELKQDIAALAKAKIQLAQAVRDAEQARGGKAMTAAVSEQPGGAVAYQVDLIRNGQLQVAMADAQNGQLR